MPSSSSSSSSSSSDDDDFEATLEAALEAQQWLLETSLPLVFEAHDDALQRQVVDPVVLLLDCEDAIGSEIARSWLGDDAVDDAIAALGADEPTADVEEGESETTVFAVAFPLAECRYEIPPVFPYLAPALDSPPDEGFFAISITAGGASILTVPPDARPEGSGR